MSYCKSDVGEIPSYRLQRVRNVYVAHAVHKVAGTRTVKEWQLNLISHEKLVANQRYSIFVKE